MRWCYIECVFNLIYWKARLDDDPDGQFLRSRENLRTLAWRSWFKGDSQKWWWSISQAKGLIRNGFM